MWRPLHTVEFLRAVASRARLALFNLTRCLQRGPCFGAKRVLRVLPLRAHAVRAPHQVVGADAGDIARLFFEQSFSFDSNRELWPEQLT